MATAAVQLDEEALVLEQIRQIKLPVGVTFRRVEEGQDWTGYPALGVNFAVSKRVPLTKQRLDELSVLSEDVTDRILALKLGKWPFIKLLEAR